MNCQKKKKKIIIQDFKFISSKKKTFISSKKTFSSGSSCNQEKKNYHSILNIFIKNENARAKIIGQWPHTHKHIYTRFHLHATTSTTKNEKLSNHELQIKKTTINLLNDYICNLNLSKFTSKQS